MQRPLPHPLGPCCLGTCLSAAAWNGKAQLLRAAGDAGENCFVWPSPSSQGTLTSELREAWSSPGRDPSISSGEGLAHVLPEPWQDLPSTATPSQPTAPGTRDPQPRRSGGCCGGRCQGVGRVRVEWGPPALSQELGQGACRRATGKRTEEGDSGPGPWIYAKRTRSTTGDRWRTDYAKLPTMPGCELGPIPHRQGAFLRGRRGRAQKAGRGLPRPTLGSTLTLILVASLFVT